MNKFIHLIYIALLSTIISSSVCAQDNNEFITKALHITREEIRSKIPEGLSPDFDKKVETLLDMCSKYHTEQALITKNIPKTLNAEGLESLDPILMEKYGFNTKNLSEQFIEIINYINLEITPTIQKKIAEDAAKYNEVEETQSPDKNTFVKKVDGLIKKLEQLDLQLEKYEKNIKLSQKKYLSKTKNYISITADESVAFDNKTVETRTEEGIPIGWYPSKYYLIKDVEHVILLNKEIEITRAKRQGIKSDINSLNNYKIYIYQINDETNTKEFINTTEENVTDLETFVREQSSALKKMNSISMYAGEPASTIGLYLALVIKDLVDVETQGKLVSKEQRGYYRRSSKSEVLKRYFNTDKPKQSIATHASMLTFLATMKLSNMGVQALFTSDIVVSSMAKLNSYLYGAAGTSLIRGVAIQGIPLAISGVLSQAIGIAITMNKELFSDNEEIRKASFDYAAKQFSARRISNMLISYTASGFLWSNIWEAKDYFGLNLHLAKKKKCAMMHDELTEEIKNYRQKNTPNTKWQNFLQGSKNFASFTIQNVLVIKTGDIIDGYLISGLLFPIDTKASDAAWINVVTVQIDQFNKALVNAKDESQIDAIYSKFNDYIILEQIVNIFKARKEILKTCLNIEGNANDKVVKQLTCLNNFAVKILSKQIKDPNSVVINNLLAGYTEDLKAKEEYSEKARNSINSENSKEERKELIVNQLFADTANDKLSKEEIYKKADAIVKIATIADEVSNDENIALMNIRSGNLEKSKIYLKKAMNLEEKETLPPTILDAFDTEMKDMVINCKDLYTNYKNLFDVVFPDIMLVTMVNNNRLVGYFVLRQKVLVNLALLKYNKAKAAKCKNLDETMEKLRQEYSPYFDQPSDLAHNTIQIFFNNIKK